MIETAPYWALLLGAGVRLSYVLRPDFPLNDGGLFYVMVQELQRSGFALPAHTAYNQAGIPFAYPPLGLYLTAVVASVGPWTLLDVFRFLPLAANVAAIAAFYALARAMLATRHQACYAVVAFPLLPFSFFWQIAGGGIARSPGFLFAILALWQGYRLYTSRRLRHAWPTMLLAACTVLSHPSVALFLAYSLALFFAAFGRGRRGLAHSALVACGTLVLSAPWWLTVGARHGFGIFLSAAGTGGPPEAGVARLTYLALTGEPYFPLLAGLALLGTAACLRSRRFLLPAWVIAIFVVDSRVSPTMASIPLALLAGLGTVEVLLPFLNQAGQAASADKTTEAGVPANVLAAAAVIFLLEYAALTARDGMRAHLAAVSPGEREAMAWIATNTGDESRFLVISPGEEASDRSAEWFPALAGRPSVTTYQGCEWLGSDRFHARWAYHQRAQRCADQDASCLEAIGLPGEDAFTHLYVARPGADAQHGPGALLCSLAQSAEYELVYDGPAAQVFRRRQ